MKGTTSVPMCSIFVHRCVPLVLFSLFWAFDVFPFFLLCNFLFYVVAHAELVDLFSFHVVTPSCHSFYLTIFLLTNWNADNLWIHLWIDYHDIRSFRFWLLCIFLTITFPYYQFVTPAFPTNEAWDAHAPTASPGLQCFDVAPGLRFPVYYWTNLSIWIIYGTWVFGSF